MSHHNTSVSQPPPSPAERLAHPKDGTPTSFQVMGQLEDGRIADIIWKAVTSCRWVPGIDPNGKPASIWVVVPFRFESK